MPIWFVTQFSPVRGDCAYVEAATVHEAATRLAEEFKTRCVDDLVEPRAKWELVEMRSPICIIRWV
jgi:hypothetical protein